MKVEIDLGDKRIWLGLVLVLLVAIPNLLAEFFFPYEVLTPESVSNRDNYLVSTWIMGFTVIPFLSFFSWIGYMLGVKRHEESVTKIF